MSIDRVLNKEQNGAENVDQKLIPDIFLILVNNQKQPLHTRNSFKNKDIFKKSYQKALKRLTLFFLSNPVPFNGQDYEKQKGPGTSDQSEKSSSKQKLSSKQVQKNFLLMMYYLPKFDDVI